MALMPTFWGREDMVGKQLAFRAWEVKEQGRKVCGRVVGKKRSREKEPKSCWLLEG